MRNAILIKRVLIISLFFIIVIYSLFQGQKFIRGPIIKINKPENGATSSQMLIEVEGTAKNVSFIFMNDKPIYTDKDGNFKEKYLLSPGYNVIKLTGIDKFKKKREKIIQVVLKEY